MVQGSQQIPHICFLFSISSRLPLHTVIKRKNVFSVVVPSFRVFYRHSGGKYFIGRRYLTSKFPWISTNPGDKHRYDSLRSRSNEVVFDSKLEWVTLNFLFPFLGPWQSYESPAMPVQIFCTHGTAQDFNEAWDGTLRKNVYPRYFSLNIEHFHDDFVGVYSFLGIPH